jgi:hypothetical protein
VRNYLIRLLPRVLGVEAVVGVRVQDLERGDPAVDETAKALPMNAMALTSAS